VRNEAPAAAVVQAAIERRIVPGAVAEVGTHREVLWHASFGRLSFDTTAPPTSADTVYDLASLTKPIVTTSAILDLIATSRVRLIDRVGHYFADWMGRDRVDVTLQDLLEHASGLAARLVDRPPLTRREFEYEICRSPFEYASRTQSLYSDLGFILLGFVAADRSGRPLDHQFSTLISTVLAADEVLRFDVSQLPRDRVAPTVPLAEDLRTGRVLSGEVHDPYAAALGGAAGHAGLFGTASAVGAFARTILRGLADDRSVPPPFTSALLARATTKSTVPNSSRALGWDTMLPSSSCGTRMSPAAFGHVGFTGTSLWIDPARDRYFVLLTNRACDGGTLEEMRELRRAFHDAAAEI
jgi:CubicO group peptidase (beta-lactamase class C family)